MKLKFVQIVLGVLVIASLALAGCSSAATTAAPAATTAAVTTEAPAATTVAATTAAPTAIDFDAALASLDGKVFSQGPHGEEATPAGDISLTDAELAQIKDMHATAAIVMHYAGNDWSTAQIAGLKAQFEKMGIDVIATTDANFDSAKQVSDIETVLAMKPSIIVSIPTDPVATADAYKKAADAGVKLVFMDNVPDGLEQGKDYVSVVSADNYGNGVASAHLMAKALGGKGKIGIVFYQADFFVTQQRYEAFKKTITEDYPDIEIVDEEGFSGSDQAGESQQIASAMMTKYPDINGIWGVWDVPAEGIMAAARAMNRTDLVITCSDLGLNVAVELAKSDGMLKGLGAQRPYDQGVTEALLAGYGLLGKTAPAYVAWSALPVTHDNVLEAWTTVYHADPPQALVDASKQ